jgi:hypothetical protein
MDFDNGSEWLNWHLIRYLKERAEPVQVTRSRPYPDFRYREGFSIIFARLTFKIPSKIYGFAARNLKKRCSEDSPPCAIPR